MNAIAPITDRAVLEDALRAAGIIDVNLIPIQCGVSAADHNPLSGCANRKYRALDIHHQSLADDDRDAWLNSEGLPTGDGEIGSGHIGTPGLCPCA